MKSVAVASVLASLASAQSLCGQFDYHEAGGFYLNNNEWGSGSATGGEQCTYVDVVHDVGVSWHSDWSWSGGENSVKSYPYSGCSIPTKPLVSSVGSLWTKAEWDYSGSDIRANVAYDLFTASDPNHSTSSGDYEIMIWLGRIGGIYPIGTSEGLVNINGRDWERFDGYNGAMRVFSFIAPQQIKTFEEDVKPFFDHVVSQKGFPADSQYLLTYQFGTEPFTGSGATFFANYFMCAVN